jgi:hypothetical protein
MSMRRWSGWVAAATIAVVLPVAAVACDEHAASGDAKDPKAVASKDAGGGKGCCAKTATTAKAKGAKAPVAKVSAPVAKPVPAAAPTPAAPTPAADAPGAGR